MVLKYFCVANKESRITLHRQFSGKKHLSNIIYAKSDFHWNHPSKVIG